MIDKITFPTAEKYLFIHRYVEQNLNGTKVYLRVCPIVRRRAKSQADDPKMLWFAMVFKEVERHQKEGCEANKKLVEKRICFQRG